MIIWEHPSAGMVRRSNRPAVKTSEVSSGHRDNRLAAGTLILVLMNEMFL